MTDQRIIYSTPNGGVAVVIPTGELPIAEVLAKDVPAGATGEIVETADIPSDRSFRNAWRKNGRSIIHDMPTARETHRERIRAARELLLAALDVAMVRELENPRPSTSHIIAQKEALRNATSDPSIDNAQTVDELKATWNTDLLGPSPYQINTN